MNDMLDVAMNGMRLEILDSMKFVLKDGAIDTTKNKKIETLEFFIGQGIHYDLFDTRLELKGFIQKLNKAVRPVIGAYVEDRARDISKVVNIYLDK